MNQAREAILGNLGAALGRSPADPVAALPPTARVAARQAGTSHAELELFLAELGKLGGKSRRITQHAELRTGLAELVATEQIRRATLWDSAELRAIGMAELLAEHGVVIVRPDADRGELANCDLGVTSVDALLPETGTIVLQSSPAQPRAVSLLPRVLLAIARPALLCADLHQVFARLKDAGYFVFVTGPSRTADIELTLTIGVHGPGVLYVWLDEL